LFWAYVIDVKTYDLAKMMGLEKTPSLQTILLSLNSQLCQARRERDDNLAVCMTFKDFKAALKKGD
jgi:hypothetical protein